MQKLELKQGTKLQLASFGSTRLKGEGFAAAAQQVEEFATKEKPGASQRASEVYSTQPSLVKAQVEAALAKAL